MGDCWKYENVSDLSDDQILQIIKLFIDGNSINHIVFLLHYEVKVDAITAILRREVAFANGRR